MRAILRAARAAASRVAAWGALGGAGMALTSAPTECKRAPELPAPGSSVRHRIVVVGGGSAGVSVAAQLLRKMGREKADLAVIEPSDQHFYRPAWTLAGAGLVPLSRSRRAMSSVMPRGARWIKAAVTRFEPDSNALVLDNGARVSYDYLIVATGMQIKLDLIPGLEEALEGDHNVSTIWDARYVGKTWDGIRELGLREPELKHGGVALFTQPRLGRGCGGAAQKICWLAEDWWRTKTMVRPNLTVEFVTGRPALFPVEKYARALAEIGEERGVHVTYTSELVAVDGPNRTAVFESEDGARFERRFDFLHVTPRMVAPPVVEASPLADKTGYVDVDKYTLQHVRYPNVFAIGDSASVPTSRTIAAITAQAPVVVHNLIVTAGEQPGQLARYDGYSSSPILTRRGGLILAEFKYGEEPGAPPAVKETFPFFFDQGKEVSVLYALTTGLFPWAYWNLMTTGRWYGPRGIFEPRMKFVDTWAMP
ncbi:hypothetical protein KFE25_006824 [Diacronema lutheri]|uniref:FAD/NAD(P)-binding domain-containing protein n=1 Tax=Diacronema lutheri TaxID=2081491 RepID=A0A8J5XSN8_DIALT|nr:hypothetical protein KFE25_006824 [Diacronema lutheri]